MRAVIFTDLDGTLLDASSYSFAPAAEALERVKKDGVPLVIVSSKTGAEIERVRERMGNTDPFISENGGGVFVPRGYFPFPSGGAESGGYEVTALGTPYADVRRGLKSLPRHLLARIRAFGDMTPMEISAATGLAPEEAPFAKMRDFDEAFIFDGTAEDETALQEALRLAGLSMTKGRIHHALGAHDKGTAVRILKGLFEKAGGRVTVIALGDAPNDAEMLRQADYPVIVQRPDGSYEAMEVKGLVRAAGAGPEGWNRAVLGILATLKASQTARGC